MGERWGLPDGRVRRAVEENESLVRMGRRMARRGRGGVPKVHTLLDYAWGVLSFSDHAGYGEDVDGLVEGIKKGEVDARRVLEEWIDAMVAEGFATGTINLRLAGVRKLFRSNFVRFEWDDVEAPKLRRVLRDRVPSLEELRKMMMEADARGRFLISLMVSSGIRPGTVLGLRLRHIDPDRVGDARMPYTPDPEVPLVEVPPEAPGNKLGVGYYTFMSPEARRHLDLYLDERRRMGEDLEPDSHLIVDSRRLGSPVTYKAFRAWWLRFLTGIGLGVRDEATGWLELRLHTLRKYFRTYCDLDRSDRERLMGHKGDYLDQSYFKPPPAELLERYKETAVPRLSITEKVEAVSKEEVHEMVEAELKERFDWRVIRMQALIEEAPPEIAMPAEEEFKDRFGVELQEVFDNPGSYNDGRKAEMGAWLRKRIFAPSEFATNGGRREERVIEPSDLAEFQTAGWIFVAQLVDGRVIVRR